MELSLVLIISILSLVSAGCLAAHILNKDTRAGVMRLIATMIKERAGALLRPRGVMTASALFAAAVNASAALAQSRQATTHQPGGEANLMMPDLVAGRVPGHRRPHPAAVWAGHLRSGLVFGLVIYQQFEEPARARVDARDLGADLRDLQDLPDHAGQVHPHPRSVHRRRSSCCTSDCC